MFRTLSASIIRSTEIVVTATGAYDDDVYPVRASKVCCLLQITDLGSPYWIYIIPTHVMHQWLLLQFLVLLMMVAESVRNMLSDFAITNKQYCQSCILVVLYTRIILPFFLSVSYEIRNYNLGIL